MRNNTKKMAFMGICVSIAMILSYIEFLLPPLFSAVPGIKLGLANIIIIFVLYRIGAVPAICISMLRVVLSSLLFGSVMTLAYSLSGALFSFFIMLLLKKTSLFSTVAVSVVGGVFHNLGQILMAILLLGTREIGYYMLPLTVSGTIAGVFIGILASLLLKYIKKV